MNRERRLSFAISTALGFTTLISVPLCAQEAQSVDESESMLEEVIVTGSRIFNESGFGRTSPVTVVGMDDISSYGLTRVEDILNNLPQIETSQNAFWSNGSTGTASIDLRGLGPYRTLVLVNGRRMQPGGLNTQNADVNQIPTTMIERVEVLTGGASATYGADAVAGVVNFIMRRINGVEFHAGIAAYQHKNDNDYIQGLMDERGFDYPTGSSGLDGKSYNIDLAIGSDFADGRGNASAFITWRKNHELRQESRDYSSCALNGSGDWCGGSDTADIPNFYIAAIDSNGVIDWSNTQFLTLQTDSSLAPDDGTNRYNFAPINHFMRPDERWSAGAFVDFEINEHAISYLEVMLANDETIAQIAESGTFWVESYPLSKSNALFPDNFVASLEEYFPGEDQFAIYIGKRNTEGGPRSNSLTHSSFRVVGGVKGVISNNWDYDASYLHAQTASESIYTNDFLGTRIFNAVNAELCAETPGCIPYEVFTYQGVTQEQAASLSGVAIRTGQSSIDVFNAYATGALSWGLSAGNIMVVAGYEWRQIESQSISDTPYTDGDLLGQAPSPSFGGGYRVNELFTEANIPLLADKSWAQMMVLDLAYRWSDYSTSGSTSTYRVGLDWQIADALRIRTGYNRAVRAPKFNELYYPQRAGFTFEGDPCAGEAPEYTEAQCIRTGVTPAQYGYLPPNSAVNALFGGNPDLDPERADTFTFGIIIDPMDSMQISFDYWEIKIKDSIGTITPGQALQQCAEFGNLCERIHRSDIGSLWLGNGWVDAFRANLGEQKYAGIDAAWAWSLGNNWNFGLIGTYWLKKETTTIPNDSDSTYDCVGVTSLECFATPKWRHTMTTTYDSNSFWAATARWRYYGKVDYDGTTDLIAADNLDAHNYIDLNAVFRFMETHDAVIGVNNVLDKGPPLVGNTLSYNGNTISGFYDTLGRYVFANVTLRW